MSSSRLPLDPDTLTRIRISAALSRHRYDADMDAALQAVIASADGRDDLLAEVAGIHIGSTEGDPYEARLIAALRTLPGVDEWIPLGRRRGARGHEAPTYRRPPGVPE